MSFASEVKAEIGLIERDETTQKAQLAGMIQLLSTLNLNSNGFSLTIKTENPTIAKIIWKLIKKLYNVETELSVMQKLKLKKNHVYIIKVLNRTKEILMDMGLWTTDGLQTHPSYELIRTSENAEAYLSGCFLATGSVNSPNKSNYHLEIATNNKEHAEFIIKAIKKIRLTAKMIERRKQYIVYIKSADYITDFLAHIGATQASFTFADVKIRRDYVSSITRLENCATANEVKSVQAGVKQIKAIEKIINKKGLDFLDEKIREIAVLRIENPDLSLNELADLYSQKTGTTLSKSGMKHRLAKLEEIAEKITEEK